MALPLNNNDDYSEKATSVDDYKLTCTQFIKDISFDYIKWIEYYKLPLAEDKQRRNKINYVIKTSNTWIQHVATTIKGIDIIMNDGIQKMAEATAGQPFQIGVFVNHKSNYTIADTGIIDINVKSISHNDRKTALGYHQQNSRFRIETTGNAYFEDKYVTNDKFDFMNIHLKLNAERCKIHDVISFTIIVSEYENNAELDRRGVSTIIQLT